MSRSQEINENLTTVQRRIQAAAEKAGRDSSELTLVVVTKNFPVSDLEILYELGVKDFGESRSIDAVLKVDQLPGDIRWHFLGQIQSRKITSICKWVDVVHSLDSLVHAKKFEALATSDTLKFFVQVNLEPDRTDRGGVSLVNVPQFFETLINETHIMPIGLMTVAPQDWDPFEAFKQVSMAKEQLNKAFSGLSHPPLGLSMGMSNDFEAAITAGATHLRIGSSILGSRL